MLCGFFLFNAMQEEIWKDIPEYEGYYQVSNLGRVKSLCRLKRARGSGFYQSKERVLKPRTGRGGYKNVALYKDNTNKTIKVYQLVAMAFLGHKPDGTQKIVVDHINNNKQDDKVENLQLISARENTSKDRKGGTSKYVGVSWNKYHKKWIVYINIDRKQKFLGLFTDEYEAHLAYQAELKKIISND